jgi:hypothetical protein
MTEKLHRKEVRLSNGQTVSLAAASNYLDLLETFIGSDDQDRHALYRLRQVCLGDVMNEDDQQILKDNLLRKQDGTIDPELRAVVLSAVRGEGQALHLDSPFTNSWDRTVSNLYRSRAQIRLELGFDNAAILLNEPGFGGGDDTDTQTDGWRKFVNKKKKRAGTHGPEKPNS